MDFNNFFMPHERVPGSVGAGAYVFGAAMDWERTPLVAAHVGTIERLLETSLAFASSRLQIGQSVCRFQAVAHTIARMKVQLGAARLLGNRTASRLGKSPSISIDASITDLFVSGSLVQTALDSVNLNGGQDFMARHELARGRRDATLVIG